MCVVDLIVQVLVKFYIFSLLTNDVSNTVFACPKTQIKTQQASDFLYKYFEIEIYRVFFRSD